ncbi:MAG: FAD-binding oxidoreductase [Thermoanaerobaculia bacterium]|nr:FAD-binding oxidoreductase [Thermoanaerobaculia bacterium]
MDKKVIESLREKIDGEILRPGDGSYDEARRIWNGRFDRHPTAIARCTSTDDVVAAVRVARENDLLVSVRSGGHDFGGKSVCDGGLTIDLSHMKNVTVHPEEKTAHAEAGARWRDFDLETQKYGLATTGGTVSTVGVAGFTLGGGSGWLARKHGLGLDNLVSAEVVLASGEVVRASEDQNRDLFWALRGGSGNFGVVTSFELALHELKGNLLAGQILHPLSEARDVMREYRSFMADAPPEVQCYPFFIRVPPVDVFPQAYHGQVAIDLAVAYAGDPEEGERVLKPLLEYGEPFFNMVGPQSYTALQQTFDEGSGSGNRWYSKAGYLRELSDDAIDTLVARVEDLQGELTMVYLEDYGGAIRRVGKSEMAFPHRDAPYAFHIFTGWLDPADDERIIEWNREFHGAMSEYATGGVYVNMLDGDEDDIQRSAWGGNYGRLSEIKRKVDPENLFRHNQNIEPAK